MTMSLDKIAENVMCANTIFPAAKQAAENFAKNFKTTQTKGTPVTGFTGKQMIIAIATIFGTTYQVLPDQQAVAEVMPTFNGQQQCTGMSTRSAKPP